MYGLYLLHKDQLRRAIKNLSETEFSSPRTCAIITNITVSSNYPFAFSDWTKEHNVKPRLVMCNKCKYELVTDLPGPKCGWCHSYLITVL